MAISFPDDALQEFYLTVDEVRDTVTFVRAAEQLRPRLGKLLVWEKIDTAGKRLITDFISQKDVDSAPLYRGLLIVLAGALEQFVRRLIRDAVIRINESTSRYDELPYALKQQNIYRTGQTLQTIMQPLDHLDIDYEGVGKNIGSCVTGAATFTLNADAFTAIMASVTPKHLGNLLQRVGFSLNWDDLGRDTALQTLLNKRRTTDTKKQIQEDLQSFIRKRNRVAHSGNGGVAVSDTDIEALIGFLRPLTKVLAALVAAQIGKRAK
jgi:hypothetical protein